MNNRRKKILLEKIAYEGTGSTFSPPPTTVKPPKPAAKPSPTSSFSPIRSLNRFVNRNFGTPEKAGKSLLKAIPAVAAGATPLGIFGSAAALAGADKAVEGLFGSRSLAKPTAAAKRPAATKPAAAAKPAPTPKAPISDAGVRRGAKNANRARAFGVIDSTGSGAGRSGGGTLSQITSMAKGMANRAASSAKPQSRFSKSDLARFRRQVKLNQQLRRGQITKAQHSSMFAKTRRGFKPPTGGMSRNLSRLRRPAQPGAAQGALMGAPGRISPATLGGAKPKTILGS